MIKFDTPWKKVLLVLAIILVAGLAAMGIYAAYKPLRAQQLAAEALKALEAEDYDSARQKVRAANSLMPNNLQVARAQARVWSRLAPAEVVPLWEHVVRLSQSAPEDRQQLVLALLEAGELDRAKNELDSLLKTLPEDMDTQYANALWQTVTSQYTEALKIVVGLVEKNPNDPRFWELYGSLAQRLSQKDKDAYFKKITQLIGREDKLGYWALREQVFYSPTKEEFEKKAETLLKHPMADRMAVLYIQTLKRRNWGASYEEIRKQVEPLFSLADNNDRKMLGRFYRTIGDNEALLEVVPARLAVQDKEALLLHIDALAGLQKWNSILEIMSLEKLPLEEYWKEIFRARSYGATQRTSEAELAWRKSLVAAGNDTASLGNIAQYLATLGAVNEFDEVMRRIVQNSGPVQKQNYYKVWISFTLRTGDLGRLQALLEKAAVEFPKNSVIQNDYIYYSLLADKQGDWVIKSYELAKASPNVLAHRMTLALALYKSGQNNEALEVVTKTRLDDWTLVSPGWQCVRAAILKKAGRPMPVVVGLEAASQAEQALLK